MEIWEKVTTRSRVSIYRTNDPMETVAAIGLKLDQDDRHTHIWRKKNTLSSDCTQVSDRCPWATIIHSADYIFLLILWDQLIYLEQFEYILR